MKCKFCEAELEEGVTLCPQCGRENEVAEVEAVTEECVEATTEAVAEPAAQEEKEPIVEGKLTPGKIALLVTLAVAAIAVVVALIMGGMSGNDVQQPADPTEGTELSTEATEATESLEVTEATVPADGNPEDITCKGTYTVDDETARNAREEVVATLGDAVLTNGELQIHYWMQFYDFLSAYGSYASYLGLDYTQPLDTQISADGSLTWQQYMLAGALDAWQSYEALAMEAEKAGFQMAQEYVDFLAQLPQSMESSAQSSGYETAQQMLEADMGPGCTMDDYMAYMQDYYMGYLYYLSLVEQIDISDAEVEAYYDQKADSYAASGVEKDEQVYVDVRHILVMPKGGTTAEDGTTTYSDEEWETCRASAQAVLDQWMAGEATEEYFAELANTYSEDGGSNTNGGLYEDVYVGQMVEPFENWCFDESRQYGDTGLVQTTYGYHVMFFVEKEPVWMSTAKNDLFSERQAEILANAMGQYELELDYSAIKLGFVDFSAQ